MTTISFIIIVFVILLGLLSYAVFNLLRKVELYEDKIEEYEKTILLFQKYYAEITQAIRFSDDKLNMIDNKGTFKGDDEVGYFFTLLKDVQVLLNSFDYSKPKLEDKTDK